MFNLPLAFISEEAIEAIQRYRCSMENRSPEQHTEQPASGSFAGRIRTRLNRYFRAGDLLLNFDGPNSIANFERAMRGK